MVSSKLLSGFTVGRRSVGAINISHPLFMDDTLIFNEVNPDLHKFHCLFLYFEAISGLRINLAKLELVLVDNVDNVKGLASTFSCRVSSLPMKYLGLSLGASFKAKSIWDALLRR